jgi:enolase
MSQEVDSITPLNQLIRHLDYAVDKDNLSPEQALEVLAGERSYFLDIDRQELPEEILAAFNEFASTNQAYQFNFRGGRYEFNISHTQTWFEITAILGESDKRSTINTLNYILSAFDIEPNSNNAEESDWSGTPEQVQTWVQTAQSLFGDKLFLEGLERALDQDRQQGEWEEN